MKALPSDALLDAVADHALAFDAASRQRGLLYARERRVELGRVEPLHVEALVRGTDTYATSWTLDERTRRAKPSCNCPVGPDCKHSYAVAAALMHEARHQRVEIPGVWRAVIDARDGAEMEDLPLVPVRTRPAAIRDTAVEASPGARQERAQLQMERLRTARGWDRRYALAEMLHDAHGHNLSPFEPPYSEILEEEDPDLLCWRLANAIATDTEGWVPKALEPFRHRDDLKQRSRDREYARMADGLIDWAEHRGDSPQRTLRVVLGAEIGPDEVVVTLEVRMTSARHRDAPRSMHQVHQLAAEVRRDPSCLPPPQVRLLHILTEAPGLGGHYADLTRIPLNATTLHYLLDRLSNSPFATWGALPGDIESKAGVKQGDRLRQADESVRLLPVCERMDGKWWVAMAVVWPDGRRRPLVDLPHVRSVHEYHPTLVLAEGRFWTVTEEPPPALLELFEHSGAFPVGEHDLAYLERLMTNFPTVRAALAPHIRLHPASPAVTLTLHSGDWLEMHFYGHSGSGAWHPERQTAADTVLFEMEPGQGWVRRERVATDDEWSAFEDTHVVESNEGDAQAGVETALESAQEAGSGNDARDAEILLEQPDDTLLEPVRDWLESLPIHRPRPGRAGQAAVEPRRGWWIRLNAKTLESLASAWDQRPAGVAWFGNRAAHDLLSGARRIVPRLRIRSSGIDWLSVSAEWEATGLELSDADLNKLRRARTRFVRLGGTWVRRDLADEHDRTRDLLAEIGVEPGAQEQKLTLWQLAQAGPQALDRLEALGGGPEMIERIQDLRRRVAAFSGLPRIDIPEGIRAELRPYQRDGLDFLVHADSLGMGAVLADDMGLGKTVQALAWLEHLKQHGKESLPTLVLCPASVVHNWAREAERFAPGLRVLLLESGRERHAQRDGIPDHDLVVTNYALFRRDIALWREVKLRALILDEAQNLKNPDAAVTRAVRELNVRHRLALTGTPLENRALDLWSILSVLDPGYLGDRASFEDLYDRADRPAYARRLLASRLRPVLLRRLKKDVEKDLPERIEEVLECPMTRGQRQLYLGELARARKEVDRIATGSGGLGRGRIEILAALTRLRQICCHPAMAGGRLDLGSGKFEAVFELLESLREEGHKVLLFSQFVECLELLRAEMRQRRIPHHILTGATTKREQVVKAFTEDPDPSVFLISLRAGGTGLNLTAASHVILFDPWWNPAVEAQAIDRTHRIGQHRTVIAFRLLTSGTIEERIAELQKRKADLARDVLEADGFARVLSREDLDYLLEPPE